MYRDNSNNSSLIRIIEDKDILWLISVLSDLPENDLCVVVDHVSSGSSGNTMCFNNELGAYTSVEFEYYMRQLGDLALSIRHELEDVGKSKWVGHFVEGEDIH